MKKTNETRELAVLSVLTLLASIAGAVIFGRILWSGCDAIISGIYYGLDVQKNDAIYRSYMNAHNAGLDAAIFIATLAILVVFAYCVCYTIYGIMAFLEVGVILKKRYSQRKKRMQILREKIQNRKIERIAQEEYKRILPEE